MPDKVSRRKAIVGISSTLIFPTACTRFVAAENDRENAVFAHGVASGDPDNSSIVIWTRVSELAGTVNVSYSVALDIDFHNIVKRGVVETSEREDHTVKVVVGNLSPGKQYFYRFVAHNAVSPIGRTKILPSGNVDKLVLAVVSCSNYPFGYFNAYEVIANDDDIDIVLHLGDYIYEYSREGYGGSSGQRLGRDHLPAHEALSLQDYRTRHAQYKADPQSQRMHARHPLVAIWDDHESANNSWMHGAKNHQANEGSWDERRDASLQAYYEWMPIRDPLPGRDQQYWRHLRFGDLASITTLEGRHTGRGQQLEYSDYLNRFQTPAHARLFLDKIVGSPNRRMLSEEMEEFVSTSLRSSVASGCRWRVIANQCVMAKWTVPRIDKTPLASSGKPGGIKKRDQTVQLGRFGLPNSLDAWSGYPVARERFYDICKDAGASDLLVLAGDTHSAWTNSLYDINDRAMGVELGAPGVTSPSAYLGSGRTWVRRFDRLIAEKNKEIEWVEGRHRGFVRLTMTPERANARFVAISNVESRDYESTTLRSVDIEHHDNSLRFIS